MPKPDADAIAAVRKKYPQLTPVDPDSKASWVAQTAKNVRALLKSTWPGVTFRVRSESFAGGTSIHVNWMAWDPQHPKAKEVDALCNLFSYGSFDGMTDSYSYNENQIFTDVFGGSRYILSQANHPTEEQKAQRRADLLEKSLKKAAVERNSRPRM